MKARHSVRPIFSTVLVGLVVILLTTAAAQAYVIHRLRALGAVEPNEIQHSLAGLSYDFNGSSALRGSEYFLTMAVQGGRSFTIPVRFTQGGQPVAVPQTDAAIFAKEWVKARAIGIAQAYSRMDADGRPYLPIAVEHPGTP